jgi:hypothetical protein
MVHRERESREAVRGFAEDDVSLPVLYRYTAESGATIVVA